MPINPQAIKIGSSALPGRDDAQAVSERGQGRGRKGRKVQADWVGEASGMDDDLDLAQAEATGCSHRHRLATKVGKRQMPALWFLGALQSLRDSGFRGGC